MKKIFSFLMIVWVCVFVSACSSQTKSETESKADSEENSTTLKPNVEVKAYKEPLTIPAGASTLIVVTYRGKQQMGKIIRMPIAELKKRAKVKI